MKISSAMKKLALFSLAAVSMLQSCKFSPGDHQPDIKKQTIETIMSDDHRQELFHDITQSPVAEDAMAQKTSNKPGAHDIDIGALGPDNNAVHLSDILKEKIKQAPKDITPSMYFSLYGDDYSVPLKDLIEVDSALHQHINTLQPGTESNTIYLGHSTIEVGVFHDDVDGEEHFSNGTISAASFVYMSKETMIAAMAHEAGHLLNQDNPTEDHEIARNNEFRADSVAAELTSPASMKKLVVHFATGYQEESRHVDSLAHYLDSPQTFGFDKTIAGTHPGDGRRIQYMEMMELFKKGELKVLETPPAQSFTPAPKKTNGL